MCSRYLQRTTELMVLLVVPVVIRLSLTDNVLQSFCSMLFVSYLCLGKGLYMKIVF